VAYVCRVVLVRIILNVLAVISGHINAVAVLTWHNQLQLINRDNNHGLTVDKFEFVDKFCYLGDMLGKGGV